MACSASGAASNHTVVGYDSAPCAIIMLVGGHYIVGCIKSNKTTDLFLQCCGSPFNAQKAAQTLATSNGYSFDPRLRRLSYPVMTVHKSQDGLYCPGKVDSFSVQTFESWGGTLVRGDQAYAQQMSEMIGLQEIDQTDTPDRDFSPTVATIECMYSHCPDEYTPYRHTRHAFSTSSQQHVSMQAGKSSSTLPATAATHGDAEEANEVDLEYAAALMLQTLCQQQGLHSPQA